MAQVGDQYGEYVLDRYLGGGKFGEVWQAHKYAALVPVPVAIKLLTGAVMSRDQFLQEANLWLLAAECPYVVPVLEAGEDRNTFYFVSQFLADGTLLDRLGRNTDRGVPAGEAAGWMHGILEGLSYLHDHDVMHLDLKPANILLQGSVPKLADFGISRVLPGTYQAGGAPGGTMAYMPPEAFDGNLSRQWDVWSAGVVLFELVAGTHPFEANTVWTLMGAIREGRRKPLPAGIPTELTEVIEKALQVDRKQRFTGPREMLAALDAAQGVPRAAVPREAAPPADLRATTLRLPPFAPGKVAGEQTVNPVDGAELVWVPAGEFPMGSHHRHDEKPIRSVWITRGFWLYRTPVTNAQYGMFLAANPGHRKPLFGHEHRFNGAAQPVVGVSWEDAAAYGRWAGGRLPTEAEWEYAARGPEGRTYPWGERTPTAELAVFGQDWGTGGPAPVGGKPQGVSWCGALDLAGNAWEWCEDWYDETFYLGRPDPDSNPARSRQETCQYRVLRGGSWDDDASYLRGASRFHLSPEFRNDNGLGFRPAVAADAE